MNTKVKDIIIRAVKTFIQGAGSVLIVYTITPENLISKNFWLMILISAIAGGLSALQNSIKAYLETKKGE